MYYNQKHQIGLLFLIFIAFSCSEEIPLPDNKAGAGPGSACKIDSLIFEENWYEPRNYYYNEEGNISSYKTYYNHYKFHYSDKNVNLAELFANDQLEKSYDLQYVGEMIRRITYKNSDGAVFKELRFHYEEDQVKEIEVWKSNSTELYLSEYYDLTFEEENVSKMETIAVNNSDVENKVAFYIFDDKINPFKNDLAHFFSDGNLIKFFSSNNILYLHEEEQNGSSYELIKISYADAYEEVDEYNITYACN